MKTRHVFAIDTVEAATAAVMAARRTGIEDGDISLVANADIEMNTIPDELKNAESDFVPAALRGALAGGAMGLAGGVIGVVVPAIGLTAAGFALVTLVGVAVGTWVSALVGSAVPDEVRRKFAAEIAAGRILIIIDETEAVMADAEAALRKAGAQRLDYECTSAFAH